MKDRLGVLAWVAGIDRRLAAPSNQLTDPEDIRRAMMLCRIANVLGMLITVSAAVSLFTTVVFPDPEVSLGYAATIVIAIAALLFWCSLQLARQPAYQRGAWLLMVTIDAFLIALSTWAPEFSVALVLGFVVPVLLSTIVLPVRGTLLVFGVTTVLAIGWVGTKAQTVNEGAFLGAIVIVVSALTMLVSVLREQDLAGVRRLRALEQADAERLRNDLELARRVQLAMLPDDLPAIPGIELATFTEPAFEASGDFYDLFQLGPGSGRPGCIGIVVCDVAGKGVASALVMSATRAALRAEAERNGSPGRVLRRVNTMLAQSVPPGLFVTAFYGVFDPVTRRMAFASGGHPHPIHHRRTGDTTGELVSHGFPLGLLPDATFDDAVVDLGEGDVVVAYTDGLVEALDGERRMYGFDTVLDDVAVCARQPGGAEDLLGRVVDGMRRFVGDERLHDDVTIVVLSVGGRPTIAEGSDGTDLARRHDGEAAAAGAAGAERWTTTP